MLCPVDMHGGDTVIRHNKLRDIIAGLCMSQDTPSCLSGGKQDMVCVVIKITLVQLICLWKVDVVLFNVLHFAHRTNLVSMHASVKVNSKYYRYVTCPDKRAHAGESIMACTGRNTPCTLPQTIDVVLTCCSDKRCMLPWTECLLATASTICLSTKASVLIFWMFASTAWMNEEAIHI